MIKPILHRILIKQDVLEEKDEVFKRARAAGIDLSGSDERTREQAAVDTGTVVSIGATAFRDFGTDSPIKEGDYIWFAKHAGKTITHPTTKEKLVALNDEDIICILTKEGA